MIGKMTGQMEAVAAQLLGEAVVTSLFVLPRNSTPSAKSMIAGQILGAVNPVGGAIGGVINGAVAAGAGAVRDGLGRSKEKPPPQAEMTQHMLLVVGRTRLGLVEWKQGFFKNTLGRPLHVCPKGQVVRFETGAKTKSFATEGLTLDTSDGRHYEFEIHKSLRKQCRQFQEALGRAG